MVCGGKTGGVGGGAFAQVAIPTTARAAKTASFEYGWFMTSARGSGFVGAPLRLQSFQLLFICCGKLIPEQ